MIDERDQIEQSERFREPDQVLVFEIHDHLASVRDGFVRRVGQPTEHLQIGDQCVHLGEIVGLAVEHADIGRLAVALGSRHRHSGESGAAWP